MIFVETRSQYWRMLKKLLITMYFSFHHKMVAALNLSLHKRFILNSLVGSKSAEMVDRGRHDLDAKEQKISEIRG